LANRTISKINNSAAAAASAILPRQQALNPQIRDSKNRDGSGPACERAPLLAENAGTFNVAFIKVAPVAFGNGPSMTTNNISLEFDFRCRFDNACDRTQEGR